MRLLYRGPDVPYARRLSQWLAFHDIGQQLDCHVEQDWAKETYADREATLWVIDEDQMAAALTLQKQLPDNWEPKRTAPLPTYISLPKSRPRSRWPVTTLLLALCVTLFVWINLSPHAQPIYGSPIRQTLLFDDPQAFKIIDTLISTYGKEALEQPFSLPPEGINLLFSLEQHPYWLGLYQEALNRLHGQTSSTIPPLFEKIRQGELWRLVSPILLHADIFHLLFNLLWLYVLGRQMEIALGSLPYLGFILITATFSNTVQYLMGGAQFIGLSGVLCAMLTFIWNRRFYSSAYQLLRPTFFFMMLFIGAMAALQALAFVLEAITGYTVSTQIANSAHISGALLGLALAKSGIFHERA